ncbi:MAG: hypothetical protein H7256_15635 [Bdellovibrio sp.]|nr:hypothetical protein [Bdellovibrio sp.]
MSRCYLKSICLVTLIILTSCQTSPKKLSSDDLIISDQASLTSPEKVTNSQAAQDIQYLIYALKNGYGGRDHAPADSFAVAIDSLNKIYAP